MNPIKFNLKSPKADTTLIIMIYRYDGQKLVMSTGIKIPPKHWNKDKCQVRELKGYFEYPAYNNKLSNYQNAVRKAETNFARRSETPTILQLKAEIKRILENKVDHAPKAHLNVHKYITEFIIEAEAQGKSSKGLIQSYSQLKNVLGSFKSGKSLQFRDLTNKMLSLLVRHMVSKYQYQTSQIEKLQRRLITICNNAKLDGYIINEAIYNGNWKVKLNSLNENGIAYSEEDLKAIEKVKLPPDLEEIRDWFFLGVSVGQRLSDFKNISYDSIINRDGKEYFDIVQKKGSKKVLIPVSKRARKILDKYNGELPKIYSSKFNDNIKLVIRAAKLKGQVIIRKSYPLILNDGTNKGQKIVEDRFEKYEVAASHDCRRTYATLAHKKGIPPGQIMKVTGHSNLKTFSRYLKINLDDGTSDFEVF